MTRPAEPGSPLQEIAAITGHTQARCTAIIERYMISTDKMAEQAF